MARAWLVLSCFLLFTPVARAGAPLGPYRAEIVRVLDGDSFEARVRIWLDQEVTVIVRIADVDTAELGAPCLSARLLAAAARAFLGARIGTKPVFLLDVGRDKFGGRVIARVTDASGADLGVALLAAGLARPYRGRRADWCRAAGEGLLREEEREGDEKS